jgi:PEP-CTERM motif-containing protein
MRKLCVWLVVFAASFSAAKAETIYVDASVGGSTDFPNICVAAVCAPSNYLSPLYKVSQGDIVDFGTVTINPIIFFGASYTPVFIYNFGPVDFSEIDAGRSLYGVCPQSSPLCTPASPGALTVSLTFTIPNGDSEIQLGWSSPYVYVAPTVPETSTWAMLLIGLASIGFMCRRKSKPALVAA